MMSPVKIVNHLHAAPIKDITEEPNPHKMIGGAESIEGTKPQGIDRPRTNNVHPVCT